MVGLEHTIPTQYHQLSHLVWSQKYVIITEHISGPSKPGDRIKTGNVTASTQTSALLKDHPESSKLD